MHCYTYGVASCADSSSELRPYSHKADTCRVISKETRPRLDAGHLPGGQLRERKTRQVTRAKAEFGLEVQGQRPAVFAVGSLPSMR